jgi:uncharacterized RDD family membrane protein YckC
MKTFSARETLWLQELDGLELASFRRRAFAFLFDAALVAIVFSAILSTIVTIEANRHPDSVVAINLNDAANRLAADHGPHAFTSPRAALRYELHHDLLREALKILQDIIIPILYFGLFLWQGNGRTPGKRLLKIRVVSLVHTHITFWHAVERALGYGAAFLEFGFGFAQYFIHPYHRCAQDRLAETIVVTERAYQRKFPPSQPTPPESETLPQ